MSKTQFSSTLWGQVLKSLDPKIKSALDKNTIHLCRADYDYDKKEMKIFAINVFAKKAISKYLKNIKEIVDAVMFSENNIEIVLKDEKIEKKINIPKKKITKTLINGLLYKKFDFESFISGKSNSFAYKACLSVAMKTGSYNPLVVFSLNSGVGKTHLLHSIANYIQKNDMNKKVLITSAKSFLQEYISNIKDKNYSKLKKDYLKHDILIFDNINSLASKIKTQEELLNILEEFLKHDKQIVFSSNKHPINLENFVPSLKDILSSATIAEITDMSYDLAKKILTKKFEKENFKISEDLLNFIIETFDFSSVREIDGIVKSVIAYFSLSQEKLDKKALNNMFYTIRSRKKDKKEDHLIKNICSYYGIKREELLSKSRDKKTAYARQITMYLLREELGLKLKEISVIFSKKSHATAIHAIAKVSKEIKNNEAVFLDINNIKRRISKIKVTV